MELHLRFPVAANRDGAQWAGYALYIGPYTTDRLIYGIRDGDNEGRSWRTMARGSARSASMPRHRTRALVTLLLDCRKGWILWRDEHLIREMEHFLPFGWLGSAGLSPASGSAPT